MTAYRPQVYCAGRLQRGQLFRAMRQDPDWSFCDFTSSWTEYVNPEQEYTPAECAVGWSKNFSDIKLSDFILLYGREDTAHLRGALVECGYGLSNGLRIVTVGLSGDHTWSYHPHVTRCNNLVMARTHLMKYTIMVGKRRKDYDQESA